MISSIVIISEYSAFTPISLGDLHPEIQPFKKKGENQAGPLFTIVNCEDAWMIALELDQCVSPLFIQMTVSLDAGIQMRCGKIHCIQN